MGPAQRENTPSCVSIRGEHGPASEAGKFVHSNVAEWRRVAGVLVVVNQEAVFRMNADHGSADFKDLRDFRELIFEDVGDLFFEVLVEVLGSEGGGRESVPDNVVHASEGGVGERGREGFEADELKFFFERRAEAWRVCEVDQVVDLCGQGYNLCDCALDVEGAGTFFLWGKGQHVCGERVWCQP